MNYGQKKVKVKPPDKGSFPLDHEGECRGFMVRYMDCLRRNHNDNSSCRNESKAYLQCRMEKQLMAEEDFKKLGYQSNQKM